MSEPKRKIPMSEIPNFIRNRQRLSPTVRELIDAARQHHECQQEAFQPIVRDINEGFVKLMASTLKLEPQAFVAIPAHLEKTAAMMRDWDAVKDIPGAKISITYTSEVTVNGIRIPDENES